MIQSKKFWQHNEQGSKIQTQNGYIYNWNDKACPPVNNSTQAQDSKPDRKIRRRKQANPRKLNTTTAMQQYGDLLGKSDSDHQLQQFYTLFWNFNLHESKLN